MKSELKLRNEIIDICKRIYEKGYIAATDGNISARLGSEFIITTQSGFHKGYITAEQLVKTDLNGNSVEFNKNPSGEIKMHCLVYKLRPDINAAIHAHPPYCVALSLAEIKLGGCLLPEAVLSLGPVPITEYATPTTQEVPQVIEQYLPSVNALILARHGSLTLGKSLEEAYNRLESLEHTAKIIAIAKSIGNIQPLTEEQRIRLENRARQLGIPQPAGKCILCNGCVVNSKQPKR